MTTLDELKEQLKERDQLDLIEELDITSEEIVERFDDKIEDKYESLVDDPIEEDIE